MDGGPNWIDVDTVVYNKSLTMTYNYAFPGAVIDKSLVAIPLAPFIISMTDQVNEFLATAAKRSASTPWSSENTLFSIWIGINDIGNSYSNNGSRSAFSDVLLNAEFTLVEKLVSHLLTYIRNCLMFFSNYPVARISIFTRKYYNLSVFSTATRVPVISCGITSRLLTEVL